MELLHEYYSYLTLFTDRGNHQIYLFWLCLQKQDLKTTREVSSSLFIDWLNHNKMKILGYSENL